MILKKIGILSAGFAAAIVMIIFSIIQTISLFAAMNIPALSQQFDAEFVATIQAAPLIFGVSAIAGALISGFVAGILVAIIYNYIVVRMTGGLKIELAENKKK